MKLASLCSLGEKKEKGNGVGTPGTLVTGGCFSKISSDSASIDFLEEVPKAGLLVSMATTASTDLICKKFMGAISK